MDQEFGLRQFLEVVPTRPLEEISNPLKLLVFSWVGLLCDFGPVEG